MSGCCCCSGARDQCGWLAWLRRRRRLLLLLLHHITMRHAVRLNFHDHAAWMQRQCLRHGSRVVRNHGCGKPPRAKLRTTRRARAAEDKDGCQRQVK